MEDLPGTNTLAYYENLKITAAKSFIGMAPGRNLNDSSGQGITEREGSVQLTSLY